MANYSPEALLINVGHPISCGNIFDVLLKVPVCISEGKSTLQTSLAARPSLSPRKIEKKKKVLTEILSFFLFGRREGGSSS